MTSPSTSPERGAIRWCIGFALRDSLYARAKADAAESELAALEAENERLLRINEDLVRHGNDLDLKNADLRAQLAKRDEDKARLDFMEAIAIEANDPDWGSREIVEYEADEDDEFKQFTVLGVKMELGRRLGEASTLREAIDAARVSADASKEDGHAAD